MSVHNKVCWNCCISYDTLLFNLQCPDCQARYYDNPNFPQLDSQGRRLRVNMDAIRETQESIEDTLRRMNREGIVIHDRPIENYRYTIGVDPYRTDNDTPTITTSNIILDENGNIVGTT